MNVPVDRQLLLQLGVPADNVEAVLGTLRRHCQTGDDVSLDFFLKQLHTFDHRHGPHLPEEFASVSDLHWTCAIQAWRMLLPKLLEHFPGGIQEAFEYLNVHGSGVTF